MPWNIDFISEEDFRNHVIATIGEYADNLQSYNISKFNSNLVDPIKLIFDKMVYHNTWEEIVKNEIYRQRDKSNNNSIGYFHQKMFRYIANCRVPNNGEEGGWDIIFESENGVVIDGNTVHRIYVELKNKHNTMNSASAQKTYIKMQNQLLQDDDCACFLVEAIAKESQNKIWKTTVNGQRVSHRNIRRVSIDNFYSLITGIDDAFYQICMVLPDIIEDITSNTQIETPNDTVFEELQAMANNRNASISMAFYLLGFSTYNGFYE